MNAASDYPEIRGLVAAERYGIVPMLIVSKLQCRPRPLATGFQHRSIMPKSANAARLNCKLAREHTVRLQG